MRIGFDAKRAFMNYTGLGNYSRYVIENVAQFFPQNKIVLYTPKIQQNTRTKKILHTKNIELKTPKINLLKSLWRTFGITKQLAKDEIEIYHGLSHELPVGIEHTSVKTVVTMHDLIFLRFPKYYPFIDRYIYERKFKSACQRADKIVAISKQTKRDLIDFFGTKAEKIEVLYHGCHEVFTQKCSLKELQRVQQKWNLPDTFVLCVGTIEERKNALILAKALVYLPEHIHLVLVGRETKYGKKCRNFIAQHQLQNRVHFLANIPLADLPAMYQNASAFAYPSEFEGFGLPILEALHSRVPVVAATGSCLEEAGGANSLYVSPNDEKMWAKMLEKAITDETLRAEMTEKGTEYALSFSAEKYAQNLEKIYRELLSSSA